MTRNISIQGSLSVPGDKSISHRALIFSTLASGTCKVSRLSPAEDCQSTLRCLQQLGMSISLKAADTYEIVTRGLDGLSAPDSTLDAGNSGTTIRLMSGLLSGRCFQTKFDGDESLRKRPMARVLSLLCEMGATVSYDQSENYPPFSLRGGALTGRHFKLSIASAQVQTALILAGLQAEGKTSIELPAAVRDHTEKMFRHMQVPFETSPDGLTTTVERLQNPVAAYDIAVPGDISSAAFFMVAAACIPGSLLTLPEVGLNPGRTLVIDALSEMGADISVQDKKLLAGEPVGTIVVRGGKKLKAIRLDGSRIAAGIDEIPILTLAGAFSEGTFSVRDAAELRVKESDRLAFMSENLRLAGAKVTEFDDGLDVVGQETLSGNSSWRTAGDHRLAMTGIIAGYLCAEPVKIDDSACIAVSYPQFQQDLQSLLQ